MIVVSHVKSLLKVFMYVPNIKWYNMKNQDITFAKKGGKSGGGKKCGSC